MRNIKEIRLLPYNKLGEYKIKKFNMIDRLGNLSTQMDDEINKICKMFKTESYSVKIGG